MKKKKSESPKNKSEAAKLLDAEKTRISTSNVQRFNAEAGLVFEPVVLEARPAGVASLRLFLEALFEPSDWIVTGYAMHETRFALAGDFNPPWTGSDLPKGAWIKVNPVLSDRGSGPKGGVTDEDCIPRHVMLELDRCPLPEQHVLWSLLIAMGLPVVTLVHSRGKSLHAVLRVSARNLEAYRQAAAALCGLLLPFLPDTTSRNPSRFTRLPGFSRGGKGHQDLIYVNPDAPVWTPGMACNATIRSLTAGLEAPPPRVRESMERSIGRTQREETEESKAEDKEFRKWASGLDLKGGLDMEHLVQAVGWESCDAETVGGERKIFVQCPWSDEHSGGGDDDGEKDAYIFERKGTARFKWGFHCSHDSCQSAGRGIRDVFELLQGEFETEFADSLLPNPGVEDLFEEEPDETPPVAPSNGNQADPHPEEDNSGDLLTRSVTETVDAELFQIMHRKRIRYCHDEETWLIWNKGVWCRDKVERIRELAKDVWRTRVKRAGTDKDALHEAARSGLSHVIDGVLKSTRSVKGIATTSDRFDADPWLLGCLNGVLDLRTGQMRPGNPEDGVSLRCGVKFNPNAMCPRWRSFMDELFPHDPAMVQFLQTWFGYSLTGKDSEQKMLILFGHGRNGKSTMLDTIRSVMGDYAINSSKGLLIANPRGADPDAATPSLADLKGKRASFVSETESDSKLAESKIKAIAGGEGVPARQLYESNEEFRSLAKVILSSNHIPRIVGTDTGIWRRIMLAEFREDFNGREDFSLSEVLKNEQEGILNWMLEGCLRWQRERLALPESVQTSTRELRESMDTLGAFLRECCVLKSDARSAPAKVYEAYRDWVVGEGLRPWAKTVLNQKIKERGFRQVKRDGYPQWSGFELRTEVQV